MKNKLQTLVCALPVLLLAACGGGGGGEGSGTSSAGDPTTPTAPVPTAQLTLSASKVSVGQAVTLSWSSVNAASCTASDAWNGAQPTSGETTLTPAAGGSYTYTLRCTGAGGDATASAQLVVPMPVLPTSYENKNSIALDDPTIPSMFGMGLNPEPGEQNFSQRAVGFADFLQEGAFSAVAYSTLYKGVDTDGSNPNKWPDAPAKLYFLRKNSQGRWTDVTSTLVKDAASRYTCVTPGFVQIADLNNDGRPDVFTGCTGPDYQFVSQGSAWQDLSAQHVLLSQSDGTYKVVQLPIAPIYGHQASLADVNGDGNVDILSTDTSAAAGGHRKPLVMWGHGDGTFTPDYTAFPADTQNMSIYGLVAIPVNGKLNVLLSGNPAGSHAADPSDYGTKVLQFASGAFQYVNDLSAGIPKVSATGLSFGLMLDAIYKDGFLYTSRVSFDYAYEGYIKTDFATGQSVVLKERTGASPTSAGSAGTLKLTSKNKLANQMAACDPGIQPSNYFYEVCTLRVSMQ
ncbi:VCBS repeat-containing protein [Variovorax sp. Sphag1AA]|uniref:FG-GAP repeat domain-containing protein n=1 Tax=Variovorax sp. Sphag1AA TaxID=2587027 RepID=UPI001608CC3E|nr:VCBS repeat-containing protein [Variovorax sp. Sphag1AA]MBB3178822.1 hypothetical protein [Variovorax sp. Sphag1AA]